MNKLKVLLARVWPPLRLALPWLLVLAPMAGLFLLIHEYRVNIPFLDDWMFVQMYEKDRAGTLTLHDFFMVQMEHRMAFVRGIMVLFNRLWPADYTAQMFFSWTLLAGTYLNVALLLKKTTGKGFRTWWPLLALAGLAIFCPVQYRIVLWTMMFQVAALAFFFSSALVALQSNLPLWVKWLIGIVCASCATQCFASGILVWMLPLPLVWFTPAVKGRMMKVGFTVAWVLVFAVTMKLYFTNLVNEVEPMFAYKQGEEETMRRDIKGMLLDPVRSCSYVFRFLGNHLSRGTSFSIMDAALFIGAVSLALYLAAVMYLVAHWRREDLRARLLPWLLFGSYSIATAGLVAMGRMWASPSGDNAISPRYVVHAVPLTVSLIVLAWLIARDISERNEGAQGRPQRIVQGGGMVLLCLLVLSWSQGWRLMDMWHSSRLRGAVNTRFYNALYQVEDAVPSNREHARRAEALGLLDPPMLKDLKLSNFRAVPMLLSSNTASLRSMTVDTDEVGWRVDVDGFACLRGRERVADGVFLTRRVPEDGSWEIFQVVQVTALPIYLMDTLNKDTQFVHVPGGNLAQDALAGFHGKFYTSQLPPGVHDVMAWAYDAHENSVYPMTAFYQVDNRGDTPRVKRLGMDPASVHIEKFLKKPKAPEGTPDTTTTP